MNFPLKHALSSAGRYVLQHPSEMLSVAKHAAGMRIAVPLNALRWLAEHLLTGSKAPTDMVIEARSGALHLAATVEIYGTRMRLTSNIHVNEVACGADALQATVRVCDLSIDVLGKPDHPLAKMIQSGAMDLSKPAQLLKMAGKPPRFIVSSDGDRFTIDLMQLDQIAQNTAIVMALETITPVLSLTAIETGEDFLLLGLKATPAGMSQTLQTLRSIMPIPSQKHAGMPWATRRSMSALSVRI